MSRKGAGGWDEDDYDDGYYDDGDYGDYDDYPAAAGSKASQQGGGKQQPGKGGGAAAGASKMAQALCGPPPPGPNGKPQKGAKAAAAAAAAAKKQASYPLAPPASSQGFAFDTPSPDEAARVKAPTAKRPAAGITLAPSKTPTYKAQQAAIKGGGGVAPTEPDATAAVGAAAASAAVDAIAELNVRDSGGAEPGPSSAAASGASGARGGVGARPARRPLKDYVMEPELARDVDALLVRELSAARAGGEGCRRSLHLVVLGHVDAGKSTLMGRLLHDLGHVSQKEAHKNAQEAARTGKASFAWAWVLDERPQERARGVTVDVAVARFVTPRRSVTLLDAPGHRDFVPNMISGAAQADAALLLVDGTPGGFEAGFGGSSGCGGGGGGGQTREHAQLARSLGVEQLAVVVSKLDTCGYDQARFESIKAALAPFLRSCGFRDSAVQWLPAVGPQGENLTAPPHDPRLAAWWSGPTLMEAVDAFEPRERHTGLPLRLPVHDVTRGRPGGLVVGGKLEAGALRPGTRVLLAPSAEVATVKALEVDGQPATLACAGDSADVSLVGVDPSVAFAGCVLCTPEFPVRLAVKLEARVLVLEVAVPLLRGQQATLHCHTAREACVISGLLALVDGRSGEVLRQRPRCLLKGQTALIEVTPARAVCLEEYADVKALGRLALREGGRTLAVGIITRVLAEA